MISLVPRLVKTMWAESRRFQRFQLKILILFIFYPMCSLCRHRFPMLTVIILPSAHRSVSALNWASDTSDIHTSPSTVHCSILFPTVQIRDKMPILRYFRICVFNNWIFWSFVNLLFCMCATIIGQLDMPKIYLYTNYQSPQVSVLLFYFLLKIPVTDLNLNVTSFLSSFP